MAKPFAEKFYKSKAWRDCRDAYYLSRYGLCEKCTAAGIIVHHKVHLTPSNINDPEITLNWDNLELLCHDCHAQAHGNSSTVEGLGFDEQGDLVLT